MSEQTNTTVLTKDDFNQDMSFKNPSLKKRTVVIFYAPWCGHCNQFKPVYEEVAKMTKEGKLGDDVTIATVNGDDNKELLQIIRESGEYKVSGFPTVVSYYDGKYYSTYGPDSNPEKRKQYRTAEDLIDYISGIGSSEITYIQE
jgi:thiol-disulfide isomerase/thioredoxin